ncbi:Ubiquitin-like protein [Dioscorea alata]|uniref:Ubiquitin-like protein n=4 Tax=Dioscorea alata TaxID=55571 RepID=A0ACB7U9P4_DIOAL|nr:Ubiquitin-like protein [Dioscorea alata]
MIQNVMVLKKRLGYDFNGFHVPPMLQVPKSAKGKRSVRKKVDDNQMCAFDLLATVADELLVGKYSLSPQKIGTGTSCPSSNNTPQNGKLFEEKPFTDEGFEQGSFCQSALDLKDSQLRENCPLRKQCSLEDPMQLNLKSSALVGTKNSTELPSVEDCIPLNSSFRRQRDNMELPVDRDDDENYSRCTNHSTVTSKVFRPRQRIGNHRIRQLLASKFSRVNPMISKNGEPPYNDVGKNSVFNSKRICYKRRRTQRCPLKRRRHFDKRSIYYGAVRANRLSPIVASHRSLEESENYHGKLSIKSFKVPELLIEIPETATIASLKGRVLEAVTAILGGGLRVGVRLQGKKVRDDSKTLFQAGIYHGDKWGKLGFVLEPTNLTAAQLQAASSDEPCGAVPCSPTEQLTSPPPSVAPAHPGLELPLSSVVNSPESDHDSVHSPLVAASWDKTSADSRALIPSPVLSNGGLSMTSIQKPKRSELAHRRLRRPFSVSEVEALVQAVERLGTGRWRDVKICAFDNANHRTYVDLKDKWKTLVHTAGISPQQRRGEPVPQKLLDRVLVADAYWSHQQRFKLPVKPPPTDACMIN